MLHTQGQIAPRSLDAQTCLLAPLPDHRQGAPPADCRKKRRGKRRGRWVLSPVPSRRAATPPPAPPPWGHRAKLRRRLARPDRAALALARRAICASGARCESAEEGSGPGDHPQTRRGTSRPSATQPARPWRLLDHRLARPRARALYALLACALSRWQTIPGIGPVPCPPVWHGPAVALCWPVARSDSHWTSGPCLGLA